MANAKTVCESHSDSQKLDLNAQNNQGNTPLHQIANKTNTSQKPEEIQKSEEKYIQNIKCILKFKPDVNIRNSEGYTCVHLAIKNKRSDALVHVLLNHGGDCDYNFTDKEGCSALYHAVSPISYNHGINLSGISSQYSNCNFKFRDVSIIKHLVEKGAKVDMVAKDGYSPLLIAVVLQRTDYVKVMLQNKDKLSAGALEKMAVNLLITISALIAYPPTEYYGMSPLLIAISDNNKEMVGMLIKAGADVHSVNQNGENALHFIIKSLRSDAEQTQVARLLIDNGINMNCKNKSGETALHLAISHDKQDIVGYILEKGLATM